MAGSSQNRARLTRRQSEILDFICRSVQSRGFPPSIREIGEAVGLSSSSTVHSHLRTLEEKKYIRRNPSKPRSIEIMDWPKAQNNRMVDVPVRSTEPESTAADRPDPEILPLPIELVGTPESFLFRVDCESYRGEAIMPGDLLIVNPNNGVREGDMVLARSTENGPARVCTYRDTSNGQEDPRLLGRVVGVIRKIPVG